MIDGVPEVRGFASLQKPCFAARPTQSAGCQEINTDAAYTDRIDAGAYPAGYYAAMHLLASDQIIESVLLMRAVNFAIFALTIAATFWLASTRVRRAMVLALAVALVPVGMFFLASVNPSTWAITGIAVQFFALLGLGDAPTRWRSISLGALAAVGAVLAAVSRGDAGAYSVAVACVGGWLIWPSLKKHLWRGLALLPPIALGLSSYFGARQTQAYGSSPFGLESAVGNFLNILEIPLGNLGLGLPLGSLGWFDTHMTATTWGCMALALGSLVVRGLAALDLRKGLALLAATLLLVGVPWYMLQKYGYEVGEFVQPRYMLPVLVVVLGTLALGPAQKGSLFLGRELLVIPFFVSVANSAALYATLVRYTNGSLDNPLGRHVEWWWSLPIGPVQVWVVGSIAFAICLFLLFTLGLPVSCRMRWLRVRKRVDQPVSVLA